MKTKLIFILLIFAAFKLQSQYTLSGYIEDAETGERLAAASIYDKNSSMLGTLSNRYGFYSLSLPEAEYEIMVSYIGYASQYIKLKLDKDTFINFSLKPSNEIEEVEIIGEKSEAEKTRMSEIDIPIETIKLMPVLLGETDVLKSVQLLPGVKSGTEGTGGIYVRGGGPDQNLILLDGVPVYNVNHLFGFFSVFNADAISDVKLIKGGFPARYGGRLSSVLDISMKEGNNKKFTGTASIGIISSKFTLEGPIIKDRTSFIFSLRRTYYDILAMPFIKAFSQDFSNFRAGYFFQDINAKVNHKISDKDRIFLSLYTGKDKAYMHNKYEWEDETDESNFDLHWGNITAAFRWNRIINNKLFVNTTTTYSNYTFFTGTEYSYSSPDSYSSYSMEYQSGIEDLGLKFDFDYRPTTAHTIKFGGKYTYHTFRPGINAVNINESGGTDINEDYGYTNRYANEYFAYAEDDFKISPKLKLNAGVHYSGFKVDNSFYQSVQPRVSARYLVKSNLSVKAAYTHMAQYIHLLTNTTIGLPTDLWLPVTDEIKPQESVQYAVGLAYSRKNVGDFSIEAYYKDMENLMEYKEGASFFSNFGLMFGEEGAGWESLVETDGRGRSYGVEFLYQKKFGNTRGWLGYTLSWAERRFANISFGQWFPYKYDRRHDISIVITHQFSETFNMGLTWVYGTGTAVTLPLEEYPGLYNNLPVSPGAWSYVHTIKHIEHRNNFRMPAYHRLDIGFNFKKEKKRGVRTWSFGAYNAYNNKNPFFLTFGWEKGERVLMQYSLFPIIPSVSWKFDF